jgi:hypothetical protein
VNSASVAGGFAPAPLHSTWLDPQSAVTQLPWPVFGSNVQPVRPQNLPDQLGGAWNERDPPGTSSNPVLSNLALPALARIPGHIVYSHLFIIVNVAPDIPVATKAHYKVYTTTVPSIMQNLKRLKIDYLYKMRSKL